MGSFEYVLSSFIEDYAEVFREEKESVRTYSQMWLYICHFTKLLYFRSFFDRETFSIFSEVRLPVASKPPINLIVFMFIESYKERVRGIQNISVISDRNIRYYGFDEEI